MEEDVKSRFDDLDKILASTEKRIDDIKWFIGGLTGLFTVIFGVITILGNLNFNAEKTTLRETERELKSQVGRSEGSPDVELLGVDGQSLMGQEVPAKFERSKDKDEDQEHLRMHLTFVVRNVGNSLSGPLYMKFYSDDIPLEATSWEEKAKFNYESYIDPKYLEPNEIPGGNYSTVFVIRILLPKEQTPPSGKHAGLFKVFYGKGKVAKASFSIIVNEKQ